MRVNCIALGKAKVVPKQTKIYEKADGETIVKMNNATALIHTKLLCQRRNEVS